MTDSENGRILVQRALQNRSPKKAALVFVKRPKPALPQFSQVWFDVRLRDEQGDVEQLQAGSTYTLVITGDVNRSELHEEGIFITRGIKLQLRCALDVKALLKLEPDVESFSLSYEQTVDFKEEFTINIPSNFPSCHLILGLSYTLSNAYRVLGEHRIAIVGTYTPEDRELLEACQMEAGLPENVAVLAVSSHPDLAHEYAFTLQGWHVYGGRLEKTSTSPAIVSVAKLMQHQDMPGTILGKIRLFSEQVRASLNAWLCPLYEHYGSSLSLIINDSTALEIPWEMYEFDDEKYIGALVKVVRWVSPRRSTGQRLKVSEVCYEGSVIAYLDSQLGARETEAERKTLQELVTEHCPTLGDLEDRIRRTLQQVGLVYIGCHGAGGFTLQQQHPDRLTAARLVLIRKHPEPRPIALINACESGRIIRGNEWGDSSFVEVLLHRCISGYIGTLGKVGIPQASRIASSILEVAKYADGVQIAEILRSLREKAVQQLSEAYDRPGNERNEYEYNLLYTFMYVYYGNPLARLRLLTADQNLLPAENQKGEGG